MFPKLTSIVMSTHQCLYITTSLIMTLVVLQFEQIQFTYCFSFHQNFILPPIIQSQILKNRHANSTRNRILKLYSQRQVQQQLPPSSPSSYKKSRMNDNSTNNGLYNNIRYSDFLNLVNSNKIDKATFSTDGTQLLAIDKNGFKFKIEALPNDANLLTQLTTHDVDITILPDPTTTTQGIFLQIIQTIFFTPLALLTGLFYLLRRRQRRGGGRPNNPLNFRNNNRNTTTTNPLNFGRSKSQIQLIPQTNVSFTDVAGCDGAKLELEEIVDFLKQPHVYTQNGCRIPRGVILDGPPGTGKTLLAKAVAGEANVPFLSISGSEFVEMFVGVGASRVRDIFDQAKRNAPCIIFIDEIDAVGRQRGAGFASGNDEREQTINQILVEMDGFDGNPGVITIAATNRIDILDQALLRPGRFDRKVTVDLPDFKGRSQILQVHARGKPLEADVDLVAIARRTPGFSGAQLENLMNEAAIHAARSSKKTIGWEQIDNALDRLTVGMEKKGGTALLSQKQNEIVAYHEAGHAIIGALIPDYDSIQKISIIPRSNGAGGLTFFSPQESRLDDGLYSKQYLESQMVVALGGRVAEEIVFGEDNVTTGASNDFLQVSNIAKRMVKEWGMSDKVGRVVLSNPSLRGPFMGRMLGTPRTMWGKKILSKVDNEVERLVNNAYQKAKSILSNNRKLLDFVATTLVEQENISAEEFQMMLVEFDAKTTNFEVFGDHFARKDLPFQEMPS